MGYIMRKNLKIFQGLRPWGLDPCRNSIGAHLTRARSALSCRPARFARGTLCERSERATENGKFSVSEEILNFLDMGQKLTNIISEDIIRIIQYIAVQYN